MGLLDYLAWGLCANIQENNHSRIAAKSARQWTDESSCTHNVNRAFLNELFLYPDVSTMLNFNKGS